MTNIEEIRARHEAFPDDRSQAVDDRATLLRALDEAKWQPIETAPMKVGVLTRGRFGPTADEHASEVQTCIAEFVEVVYGKERYKTWHVKPCSPMRSGSWQPTHWMPLPTPPATKETK